MVRLQLLVFGLLAACSCGKKHRSPPAPKGEASKAEAPSATQGEDVRVWVSSSGDGRTALRQDPAGDTCHAECTTGEGTKVWEGVAPCLGVKSERRFVAPDCERVVVINPAPSRDGDWSATEVMRVYTRNRLDHSVSGSSLMAEKDVGPSRSWLKGSADAPGQEPRYSANGRAVEFETADGRSHSVALVVETTAVAEATAIDATQAKVTASKHATKPHRKGKRHR